MGKRPGRSGECQGGIAEIVESQARVRNACGRGFLPGEPGGQNQSLADGANDVESEISRGRLTVANLHLAWLSSPLRFSGFLAGSLESSHDFGRSPSHGKNRHPWPDRWRRLWHGCGPRFVSAGRWNYGQYRGCGDNGISRLSCAPFQAGGMNRVIDNRDIVAKSEKNRSRSLR